MFTDKNLAKAAKHKGVHILHQMEMSVVIGLSYNKEVKRKAVGFSHTILNLHVQLINGMLNTKRV